MAEIAETQKAERERRLFFGVVCGGEGKRGEKAAVGGENLYTHLHTHTHTYVQKISHQDLSCASDY